MSDAKHIGSIDALLPAESAVLSVACIDETACIGCTLCIAACPVDAIVGAAKLMHTVIVGRCIGCELCLPPCPVDCIAMLPSGREWTRSDAAKAHDHFVRRQARVESGRTKRQTGAAAPAAADPEKMRRQAAVSAALTRARQRRAQHTRRTR
jgi:electron transport complex protein RnfB